MKIIRTKRVLLVLSLWMVAFCTQALDFPHSPTVNNVSCLNCHDMSSIYAKLLRIDDPFPLQNIDDTPANNLCWSCHNDIVAPAMQTHSSLTTDNGYGNWAIECRTCHNPHAQLQTSNGVGSYMATGAITDVTATTLTSAGAGWKDNEFAGLVVFPNIANTRRSYRIVGNTSDTLTLEGPVDLAWATVGDNFAVIYGKLVKHEIETPNSGYKPVRLFRPTGVNSFADGDATRDGVCEVCHTKTNHFRNDGGAPDQLHGNIGGKAGARCTESCHPHRGGFAHGKGGSADVCVQCHGHEPGTLYDPDAGYPYTAGDKASQGRGTTTPHSTHTEFDADDRRGPRIYCDSCHNTGDMPTFKSGVDHNGDGKFNLAETDVCDECHSPGGAYDGVDDAVIGAKNNWRSGGVYAGGGALKAGKEKWCAGCHDEAPSFIANQGNVGAPNVVGDEDGFTFYGRGWGFYKTGHGLAAGTYPASGAPAARKNCLDCHDSTASHIDGEPRTYRAASDNYQAGYRLKSVGGGVPMDIPRDSEGSDDFALCLSCHRSTPFLLASDMTTGFRNDKGTGDPFDDVNAHYKHLLNARPANDWDSDWDGVSGDSRISCPACHNVHGSPSPRMIRHGELISTPGTADKVPALDFQFTPRGAYPTLANSTGGSTRFIGGGAGTVAKNGICAMCHNDSMSYIRTHVVATPPAIKHVHGAPGSSVLIVTFTQPVYSDIGSAGNLVAADFALVDTDDGRTVVHVAHTAGDVLAAVTLSAPLDASGDIGVDTLAAATAASIYNAAGVAMQPAPATVSKDSNAPVIANLGPTNGATDVAADSRLTFALADDGSGVDWTTFSLQLSGSFGYTKTYSAADASVVSKMGDSSYYSVTVTPDAVFGNGEVITVTVDVNDAAGNALTPQDWSFTTVSTDTWMTPAVVQNSMQLVGASKLIDENSATGNDFSPGGPDHYATFKLGASGGLYEVRRVRFYGNPAYIGSWRISVSQDGSTYTSMGSRSVGGASQWYEYELPPAVNARYIRINDWHGGPESVNAIFEFQFMGKAVR